MGWRRKEFEGSKNCILALAVTAVNVLIMGICFDFYYDLNDDTMMSDIMSGAYSGVPDGHNMQTLYPLGAAIALCYRLCGGIPWYGLFLCLCQSGCLCLIGVRLCGFTKRVWKSGALLSLFMWGLCLAHLVNIQYTVTCAILSATAIFLFLTTPDTDNCRQYVSRNIPSMALVILAYQLRSEMLLLTFPFICLAGLYRLTEEEKIFVKENLFKYGSVLGIMVAGMLVSQGADSVAYGSEGWKDFRQFFQARTTVYDFYQELVTEDAYQEALTGLGVKAHQQTLLRNYDYGLDDEIDTELLTEMAEYATHTLGAARDWGGIFRRQAYRYYYRTLRGGDGAYSRLLLWMYAAVLAAGFSSRTARKRWGFLWQTVLLAAVRSAIWMFILMRGRDPERITHSLYLVEFALLAAMFLRILGDSRSQDGKQTRQAGWILYVLVVAFGLITGSGVASGVSVLLEEQEGREMVNRNWYAIDAYCKEHDENFYFEDVYSTVAFSRRIFGGSDSGYANYDILGGWMWGSPLSYEKMGRYGIESASEALLERDNVYLIVSDQEAAGQGFGWIENYYGAQDIPVTVEKTDSVGEGYGVYRVVRQKQGDNR